VTGAENRIFQFLGRFRICRFHLYKLTQKDSRLIAGGELFGTHHKDYTSDQQNIEKPEVEIPYPKIVSSSDK
jgi:hypothetical protein